jgi:eukaryotic-like serine/threonine-protein kinase
MGAAPPTSSASSESVPMPDPNLDLAVSLAPPSGLKPGDVIAGKYRIDGQLGAGGMGVVLSATHLDLDAPVAIKVVRDEFAQNEEVVARMLFEARAAAKMRGSHVVRVLDVARLESGAPYIVMERLEGSDLATLLTERGALPIQDAVDFLLEACEGLAEAHALGIIHRDLKPENLFLASSADGLVLKILDFGISKDIGTAFRVSPRSALTNAGFAVGSPYYMAPEQMRASPEVDTRADIWSLGAILFELLTGNCPFAGETLPVVCAKVLGDDAPSLRSFSEQTPEQLDAILRCCLQKDPSERFDSVGHLAAALRDFASTEGQRSADRSARLASGINLKSDREPKPRTPVHLLPVIVSSSSTLKSPGRSSGGSQLAAAAKPVASSAPTSRLARLLAGAGVAALLLIASRAVWRGGDSPSPTSKPSPAVNLAAAAPPPLRSQSAPARDTPEQTAAPAAPAPADGPPARQSAGVSASSAARPQRVGKLRARPAQATTEPPASAIAETSRPSPSPSPVLQPSPTDNDDLGGRY